MKDYGTFTKITIEDAEKLLAVICECYRTAKGVTKHEQKLPNQRQRRGHASEEDDQADCRDSEEHQGKRNPALSNQQVLERNNSKGCAEVQRRHARKRRLKKPVPYQNGTRVQH